ncbi:hypothetical protein LTR48_005427 [Friedmanniomyces endolithicus]|nr:hypothetical protein LTR29_001947 [Friedmanniomyces endolithicus]KAK1091878.1 hypothetical protein LTR48_005427 [Friedmanniomyces endolithicus]
MKFTTIISVLIPTFASATLAYNITQALAPGEFEKYHCLTTAKWNKMMPACIQQCQIQANKADGCAYHDFACHSVNYEVFSEIIEPCVFPPALGGHGTCSFADLAKARPLIQARIAMAPAGCGGNELNLGNFFNATLYAAYAGCPIKLSPLKTLEIVSREPTKVNY